MGINEKPLASVIIVNYRGEEILPACLDSVMSQETDFPFEVIVVDDDSDDGSVDLVESRYPGVELVVNRRNRGPAAAKNTGAGVARSEFLAFLDNDVELHPHWLSTMLAGITRPEDDLGACASHILLNGYGSMLNSTGGMINLLGYAWDRGIFMQDSDTYSYSPKVMYACSAAMMARKRVFDEVGGFDERFRYLFEDADLGWRMNIYGYRVAYEPRAIVKHMLSSTMGNRRLRNLYLYERNRLRALAKNMERETLGMVRRELAYWLGQRIRAELENGLSSWQKLILPLRMAQALAWNLAWMPDTLRGRRVIARHRVVPDRLLITRGVLSPQIGEPPIGEDPRIAVKETGPETSGRALPRKATMSRMKEGVLGPGWYDREVDVKGVPFRWTGERATFYLKAGGKRRNLSLRTVMANPAGLTQVSVRINNRLVSTFEVPNLYHAHDIPLPGDLEPGVWEIELQVNNPFRPRDVLRVEDQRLLGIAVASMQIR
jgi:GT2 family glycosyltransferase